MFNSTICFYSYDNILYTHYTVRVTCFSRFCIFVNPSSPLSQYLPYNDKTMLLSKKSLRWKSTKNQKCTV